MRFRKLVINIAVPEVEEWVNMPPQLQQIIQGQKRAIERLRDYDEKLINYYESTKHI